MSNFDDLNDAGSSGNTDDDRSDPGHEPKERLFVNAKFHVTPGELVRWIALRESLSRSQSWQDLVVNRDNNYIVSISLQ